MRRFDHDSVIPLGAGEAGGTSLGELVLRFFPRGHGVRNAFVHAFHTPGGLPPQGHQSFQNIPIRERIHTVPVAGNLTGCLILPIFGPPDPEDVKCDQLRNLNGEPRNSFNAFADANAGLTRAVIIGQRANRSITGLGSQPGGPNIRYVEDPLNRDVIIDLRHMLVVGSYTRAVGNDVERLQWASGQASGDNHQDYYSNELGYAFYARYSLAIQLNPHEFVNYLITFLNDPSDRVPLTDPAEINRVCP